MLSSVTGNLSLAGILFILSMQLHSIQCKFWCLIFPLISHMSVCFEFSLIFYCLQIRYICHWRVWWICKCMGRHKQEKIVSGNWEFCFVGNVTIGSGLGVHYLVLCSTPSTLQALLLCRSVKMDICLLWHQATLTKRERNRKTEPCLRFSMTIH